MLKELASLVGPDAVLPGDKAPYTHDATEARGLRGVADAVVLPASADEVAAVVAWCYEHDVAVVPRGGGSGFAGGAVAVDGGVVVSLERLTAVRAFDPLLWRMHVEAGVTTETVRRLARENGLWFPPDPGAAEQSQIGGNIATNAGGPHAFKYGVTGTWVTGLEAVVPPGELITVGGPIRKDVAGYDLKDLLIGSEGTLGIVTAAWLRMIPAPEAALPVFAFYPGAAEGVPAIEAVLGSGVHAAAIEYLDAGALDAARAAMPGGRAADAGAVAGTKARGAADSGARAATEARGAADSGFLVIAEADGSAEEARRIRDELRAALAPDALTLVAPETPSDIAALWRWRDGVSIAVTAQRGGKVSEDIVVPLDRLAEAIEGTVRIGSQHGLTSCSWGHAGDGNLHSSFLLTPGDADELARADAAAEDLFALAVELGGSISGEHGLGLVKGGQLGRQWNARAIALHEAIKAAFDPKGLMNPGKKRAR